MPEKITINDSVFGLLYDYPTLESAIRQMAETINRRYADFEEEIVCVPTLTGGFRFGAELMRWFTFPYYIDFIKISSYQNAMQAVGAPNLDISPRLSFAGKRILFIEDVVDTGETLIVMRKVAECAGPAAIECATLLFKPNKFMGENPPEYVGYSVADEFIVGFGLDYAERGRWLNGVYQLI